MSDNSSNNNALSNPIRGAFTCLGMAACAATGAALRGNNVHNEAITMLVGGSLTGAMAGFLGMCALPKITEESSLTTHVYSWLLASGLEVGAIFTAPLMAELVGYSVDNAKDTVVDTFMGIGVIGGGLVGLGACGLGLVCCAGTVFGGDNIGSDLENNFADIVEKGEGVQP